MHATPIKRDPIYCLSIYFFKREGTDFVFIDFLNLMAAVTVAITPETLVIACLISDSDGRTILAAAILSADSWNSGLVYDAVRGDFIML